MSNIQAKAAARVALEAWRDHQSASENDEANIRDLLADLLILAHAEGKDVDTELRLAVMHYRDEVAHE
jgi:hypothetical protein